MKVSTNAANVIVYDWITVGGRKAYSSFGYPFLFQVDIDRYCRITKLPVESRYSKKSSSTFLICSTSSIRHPTL